MSRSPSGNDPRTGDAKPRWGQRRQETTFRLSLPSYADLVFSFLALITDSGFEFNGEGVNAGESGNTWDLPPGLQQLNSEAELGKDASFSEAGFQFLHH